MRGLLSLFLFPLLTLQLLVFVVMRLLLASGPVWRWLLGIRPAPLTGRAYVVDGDGLVMDGDHRIRFWGMDAPEMDHPDGPAAKTYLAALIGDAPVTVLPKSTDKYGRMLALVYAADGTCLNAKMVADGYARAYNRYTAAYARLERQAKRAKRGLWATGGLALHPELWRQHTR